MSIVTAYCDEAKGLKLGPGLGADQKAGSLIVFRDGYATFDSAEFPDFDKWRVGAPTIEILDEAAGEVPAAGAAFICSACGKAFVSKKALNGHRLSHRPPK
jgi:hypothetical protein